jgi:hypothetical protein
MRFFRKKSNSEGSQEYLDGLISSIKQARREEDEEKPGLHSFVEADYFPGEASGPPKVPPGVSASPTAAKNELPSDEAEAIADLEAYLSALNAAESVREEHGPGDQDVQA